MNMTKVTINLILQIVKCKSHLTNCFKLLMKEETFKKVWIKIIKTTTWTWEAWVLQWALSIKVVYQDNSQTSNKDITTLWTYYSKTWQMVPKMLILLQEMIQTSNTYSNPPLNFKKKWDKNLHKHLWYR